MDGWFIANNALLVISVFFSGILSMILLRDARWRLIANRLLVFYLLGIGTACAMSFIITNEIIYRVPWLFRLPSPVYYWMFPAGFLYVWVTLRAENRMPYWGWLLFIPGLIHFAEMLPFYLKGNDWKLSYIRNLTASPMKGFAHGEGWLPDYLHNFIRGAWGSLLAMASMFLLYRFGRKQQSLKELYPGMYQFLWVFSLMMLLFGMVLLVTFYDAGHWTNPRIRSRIITITFAVSLITTLCYLILFPGYLYGMPKLENARLTLTSNLENDVAANIDKISVLPPVSDYLDSRATTEAIQPHMDPGLEVLYANYFDRVMAYMEKEKPFLQKQYRLADLARDVGIPQYHISSILNKLANRRFNDFINQYRIRHALEIVRKDGPVHSLEGLAEMSGFANRVTFTRAVQRITGENPSHFFYRTNPQNA